MTPTIGLAILSWHGYEALEYSLQSYQKNNLFSMFHQNVIFLPEQREKETSLAMEYGLEVYGSAKNLGILGGFEALSKCLKTDYILLLENDCPLIENYNEAKKQIDYSINALIQGKADVVRLRHRLQPGEQFSTLDKFRAFYPSKEQNFLTKTNALIKRVFRPQKAHRLKGIACYDSVESALKFPDNIEYDKDNDCFFVDASILNWTNQSNLLSKKFFDENIIGFAKEQNTKRHVNGFKTIEIELNCREWKEKKYKIALPKGLFTHYRKGGK
jgi:hypothetical protein